ncbi:MAG TPA: PAS domain-containing protein, partial [Desulfobacterales bacterium]|nr:PAS domain-containing protein [Desulfobacterales bacterium]
METDWNDLKESNEFLKLLLENINSAVLIADEHLQIHQFNRVFLQLFDQAGNRMAEKSFGRISGCVHAVQENKPCGETSQCRFCLLRRSLVRTFLEKTPSDKLWLERVFYINGRAVEKFLEFSTRHITFRGRKMILVIIYDVTDLEKQKIELQKKQHQLDLD